MEEPVSWGSKMGRWSLLSVPLWPQWVVTALACGLFVEYLRLILTTPAPTYRVVVTIALGIASFVTSAALIRSVRARRRAPDR